MTGLSLPDLLVPVSEGHQDIVWLGAMGQLEGLYDGEFWIRVHSCGAQSNVAIRHRWHNITQRKQRRKIPEEGHGQGGLSAQAQYGVNAEFRLYPTDGGHLTSRNLRVSIKPSACIL